MLLDKPGWLANEGNPLMSIDIHPKGSRIATAGNSIEIWSMRPILDPNAEADPAIPKRLAGLTDHQATVNVVRFSPCGTYLASGSDDKCIIIYELRPGRSHAAFGSGSSAHMPNVENWRVKEVIRGHNSNVVDLSWHKDSKLLASASYDNKVIIWNVTSGRHATQLQAVEHQGFAKGVAWDPLGSYLASQGDDGVRVWRTSNWSQEAHITKNLVGAPQQNYHLRLAWTTDGTHIIATNGMQHSTRSNITINISRVGWATKDAASFVGHSAAVCAVRVNPRMFYTPLAVTSAKRKQQQEQREQQQQQQQEGDAGGTGRLGELQFGDEPGSIVAALSQDKRFSVWSSTMKRPLVVVSKCLRRGVMDAAWTPDGYTLLACSYDGSVCICRFGEHELGKPLSNEEFQQLLTEEYGELELTQKQLVEDAAQEELQQRQQQQQQQEEEAAVVRPAPVQRQQPPLAAVGNGINGSRPVAAGGAASQAAALGTAGRGDALASRIMPQGAAAATGLGNDKRKGMAPPPPKRPMLAASATANGITGAKAAWDAGAGAAVAVAAASASGSSSMCLLPEPKVLSEYSLTLGYATQEPGVTGSRPAGQLLLTVQNSNRGRAGGHVATMTMAQGGAQVWVDAVAGQVVLAAGNPHFIAIGLKGGELLVYSPRGRRMLPTLALGCTPAILQVEGEYTLLIVTVDGQLTVMNFSQVRTSVEASMQPILGPGVEIVEVFLASRQQQDPVPLVVLSNGCAWGYWSPLKKWLKLADAAHHVTAFMSITPGAAVHGDLERLHRAVAAKVASQEPLVHATGLGADLRQMQVRATLEQWLMAGLVLNEAIEVRRALHMYASQLILTEDKARLDELVQHLLGPVSWQPGTGGYDPLMCGMDKRKLLEEEVLTQMIQGTFYSYRKQVLKNLQEARKRASSLQQQPGIHPWAGRLEENDDRNAALAPGSDQEKEGQVQDSAGIPGFAG